LIASALLAGLALGSMYGLLALGFHVTYAVSGTVNFAQGSAMMLGAVLAYAFLVVLGWPGVPGVLLALALCAVYGLLVEAIAVRPFVRRGSNAWLIATVALGIVVDNIALFTFGKEPRSLPSALAISPLALGGVSLGIYPLQALIPAAGIAIAGALDELYADRSRAQGLGQRGREKITAMNLSWSSVVETLIKAAG